MRINFVHKGSDGGKGKSDFVEIKSYAKPILNESVSLMPTWTDAEFSAGEVKRLEFNPVPGVTIDSIGASPGNRNFEVDSIVRENKSASKGDTPPCRWCVPFAPLCSADDGDLGKRSSVRAGARSIPRAQCVSAGLKSSCSPLPSSVSEGWVSSTITGPWPSSPAISGLPCLRPTPAM